MSLAALIFACSLAVVTSPLEAQPMTTIRDVKSQYQEQWLANPQVVSVGIGTTEHQQPAIILGVVEGTSPDDFPQTIEGFPLILQSVGRPKAQ